MTKVILYARFSPRRKAEQCESIEMQLELCRDYCRRQGYEIVAEYSDRALSGSEEDRPGLWNAIEALKRDYLLIVYRLDRLARSVYLSYIIEHAVNKRNAKIVSISGEGTWQDGPEDELVRRILQALAEYERKVIAARTKAAMLRHQANNRKISSIAPYGYAIDPQEPNRLILHGKEQQVIRIIRRMKDRGYSNRRICRYLESKNITPRGNSWHHATISKIVARISF
jgi:DNA invertase Pin-like site-specific DNA recombinase